MAGGTIFNVIVFHNIKKTLRRMHICLNRNYRCAIALDVTKFTSSSKLKWISFDVNFDFSRLRMNVYVFMHVVKNLRKHKITNRNF